MYNKKLYTVNEDARYLGVSVTTKKKWEDLGKVVSIKIPNNNSKFFPKEQLDKLLWRIENRVLTSRTSIR